MARVSIDPKIRLKLCSELKEIAAEIFNEPSIETLEVDKVNELRQCIQEKKSADSLHFHQLISKCELILPEPKIAPRNPELEARIQKLKAQQEQKDYEKMTDNVDPWRKVEIVDRMDKPISKQLEEINRYLLLVFQFVLSMASAFAFGYLAPFYFYGTVAVGPRLLYGIISAFVVGMADLYFVMRHLLQIEGVIETNAEKFSNSLKKEL